MRIVPLSRRQLLVFGGCGQSATLGRLQPQRKPAKSRAAHARAAAPFPGGRIRIRPRGRERRSTPRLGRAVDPAGAQTAGRRRHARPAGRRQWQVATDERFTKVVGSGITRATPELATQFTRTRAGSHRRRVLLPFPGRQRDQPRGPHPDRSRSRAAAQPAAPRRGQLSELRGLLAGLPAPRPRTTSISCCTSATTSTSTRSSPATSGRHAPSTTRRSAAATRCRLPQPLRPVQERPGATGGARGLSLGAHLGRPRGRERLRRPGRPAEDTGRRESLGCVRAAPGCRLSGVLRAPADPGDAASGQPGSEDLPRLRFGCSLTLNVLDTRQYRTPHPCGQQDFGPSSCGTTTPRGTLTGATQEAWLRDGLRCSRRTWDVVAQQTLMTQVHGKVGNRRCSSSTRTTATARTAPGSCRCWPTHEPDRALR